jgi:hypothetical protein
MVSQLDIGARIATLERRVSVLTRSPKLVNASIENTAVQVYDGTGSLRAIIGQQPDGTTAMTATNGPTPPVPTNPVVASILGGISAAWDGAFADGSPAPLDFARVEIHVSAVSGFTPDGTTLQGTLESPRGGTLTVPCDGERYVVLLSRNTSGTASAASDEVGPFGPTEVVADDVLDGIITTVKLADDAVTSAKVATGAIDSAALAADAVTASAIADAAVTAAALASESVTGPAIAPASVDTSQLVAGAVTAGAIAAGAVTAAKIAANTITAGQIAAGAITTTQIAANTILAGNIAAGAVDATAIAADAVTTTALNAGAVTAAKIAANTITAGQIAAGTITATEIAAGAITATLLSATAIDGKTITGADIRTAASGSRVELVPHVPQGYDYGDGEVFPPGIVWYSGNGSEVTPGQMFQSVFPDEFGPMPTMNITTADTGDGAASLNIEAGNGTTLGGFSFSTGSMGLFLGYTGLIANGSGGETLLVADGSDSLQFGSTTIGLVQNWTSPTLASGYTGNGNSNGTPQYRVINILGTKFVQWRGGLNLTYSGTTIANSGKPLAAALISDYRPASKRTVTAGCSLASSSLSSLKLDFDTDGTFDVVGTGTGVLPPWVSLNNVLYSL